MHIREAIRTLPTSPIGQSATLGMGDPAVPGAWYGAGWLRRRVARSPATLAAVVERRRPMLG